MDHFISEVERDMAEERERQQQLVKQQPTSGPSMSAPRSRRSEEEERRKSTAPRDRAGSRGRSDRERSDRTEPREHSERRSRHRQHQSHHYPPNPYPESSPALNRSKSDQRLPSSERRHIRETRSADFRQSAYDGAQNGDAQGDYLPSPYSDGPAPPPVPKDERYESEPVAADRRSRALLSPSDQPTERSTQRERGDSRTRTSKYPAPMANVPVVYATRTRSREDRVDAPSS
ncbi:hypothetical protein NMY22_g17423 [Coprinellus aureogranulatus]|nr:hypothetical protein NMY22_g17423 [Coprinellus aureogranulatus]